MSEQKLYEIDDLKGEALQTALQGERDGEWDGKKMTPAILKDYSRMCRTKYNEKGGPTGTIADAIKRYSIGMPIAT